MARGSKEQQQQYQKLRKRLAPPVPVLRNAIWAFVVGGLICVVGQGFYTFFVGLGMSVKDAAGPTAAVMVFLGALFTGLGLYDELVRFAGMGASLPITGFANAMVSPAMEFKREGWVMGVGAKMFTVAGPVIVYGLVTSTVVGLVWYLLKSG